MKQKLQKCWERYIQVPLDPASRERKSHELDVFLQVLIEVSNEECEVPHFGDMKSVSSILASEFLSDVHRICSSSQDEDVGVLGDYLMQGRGGVILKVLQTIGVQGLSCTKELAELLVSILPLCFKFAEMNGHDIQQEIQLCTMESCLSHMATVTTIFTIPKFPHLSEVMPTHLRHTQSLTVPAHPIALAAARTMRSRSDGAKLSSESEDEALSKHQRPGDAPRLLQASRDQALGVYPGILRPPELGEVETDLWNVEEEPPEPATQEPVGKVPKLVLSCKELCFLLLTVTKDLCHEDCRLKTGSKKYVSMSVLNSLTQLLSSLHLENVYPACEMEARSIGAWMVGDLVLIERYMVRVAITLSSYVVLQPSGVSILQVSGVLGTLCGIADSVVPAQNDEDGENKEQSLLGMLAMKKFTLATEIVHGLLLLFHSIFSHLPVNLSALSSSLKLLNEFLHGTGLDLMENVILHWELCHTALQENEQGSEASREAISNILGTLSRLITTMKRAKVNYMHAVKCSKKKHRQCDYSSFLHHHHDILGIAGASLTSLTASDSYGSMEGLNGRALSLGASEGCVVSVLAQFLLTLFQRASSKLLHMRVLCSLEEGGLCCCMVPSVATATLLNNFASHSSGICGYILSILTRVMLEHFGGAASIQQESNLCSVCKETGSESHEFKSPDLELATSDLEDGGGGPSAMPREASDSAFSGSDVSLHEDAISHKYPKWRCVRYFQPLILQENEAIGVQVMQHVLRLVTQGSCALLQEIFHQVCLPVIQMAKQQLAAEPSMQGSSETAENIPGDLVTFRLSNAVIGYALNSLPMLLQSQQSQNIFLNYGGVKQLCELVQVGGLRQCTIKVFQVLIVLEEQRAKAFPGILLEPATKWDPPKLDQQVKGETEQNRKLEDESQAEGEAPLSVLGVFLKMLFCNGVKLSSTDMQSVEEKSQSLPYVCKLPGMVEIRKSLLDSDLSRLAMVCDLWSAAETLFAQSRKFRKAFMDLGGPELAFCVLSQTLDLLSHVEDMEVVLPGVRDNEQETACSCWLAVLQATLGICLGCCKLRVKFGNRDLSSGEVLSVVKGSLTQSRIMQCGSPGSMKTLCEALMTVAATARNTLDIVQTHHFALMHLRSQDDSMLYDRDLQELSDSSSTRETETCFTEQGYEADSEVTADESNRGRRNRAKSSLSSSAGTRPKPRTLKPVHSTIIHPAVCRLVLELLATYREQHEDATVIPHTLLKLISLAKHSSQATEALLKEGILKILLEGFKSIILSQSLSAGVEQRLILELFLVISSHTLSSCELRTYLRLMQEHKSPLDALLQTLILLVEAFQLQPSHFLSFPLLNSYLASDLDVSVRSSSSDVATASAPFVIAHSLEEDAQQLEYSSLLKSSHVQDAYEYQEMGGDGQNLPTDVVEDRTAANIAVLQMQLKDNSMWPTNQQGFSVAWWMRVEGGKEDMDSGVRASRARTLKKARLPVSRPVEERALPPRLKSALKLSHVARLWTPSCLHVLSVGNSQLLFELWNDPEHSTFIFRLVSAHTGKEEVLCETSMSNHLLTGRWHHITLTFADSTNQSGRNLANLTVRIDGCLQRDLAMEYSNNLLKTDAIKDSRLLLGQSVAPQDVDSWTSLTPSWQLGNLMLFRDSRLSMRASFHLYSLGPECCTLSQCDGSEQAAEYSHYISEELCSLLSHDANIFSGAQAVYMQHLRENLILVYAPKNAPFVNLYDQSPSSKQSAAGGLRNVFGSNQAAGVTRFNPVSHQPVPVRARLATDVAAQVHKGLSIAVDEIGGIGVFLFLFAKTVEQEESEMLQAKALRLLFTLIQNNPQQAHDFRSMDGYGMLVKVLNSERCQLGHHLLKVMLDAATSRPILHYSSTSLKHYLENDTSALVRDVQVVSNILLAWRVWEGAATGVWGLAFQAVELLVRDGHPHRAFNVQQLEKVDIVGRMLQVCLERFRDLCPSLSAAICESMLSIMRSVIGQPAKMKAVKTICDFLLLTHPAASTFVFHAPDGFYFRPKWMKTQMKADSRDSSVSYTSPNSTSSASTPLASTPRKLSGQQSQSLMKVPETSPIEAKVELKSHIQQMEAVSTVTTGELRRSRSMPICGPLGHSGLDLKVHQQVERGSANFSQSDGTLQTVVKTLEPTASFGSAPDSFSARSQASTSSGMPAVDDAEDSNHAAAQHPSAKCNLFSGVAERKYSGDFTVTDITRDGSPSSGLKLDLKAHSSRQLGQYAGGFQTSETVRTSSSSSSSSGSKSDISRQRSNSRSPDDHQNSSAGLSETTLTDWEVATTPVTAARAPAFGGDAAPQDVIEEGEEGLIHIYAGLLQLLCNILVHLPEESLQKEVLGVILRPEVLLVASHHSAHDIRICALKVLDMYLRRASSEQSQAFLRYHGFHLLANQLYQHGVSHETTEACFTIMLGCPQKLNEQVELGPLLEMTPIQQMAVVPLLSLLENSAQDTALCHNLLINLAKIFESIPCMAAIMLDNGVVETLCNLVCTLNALAPRSSDWSGDEVEMLRTDVEHFFSIIGEKAFSLPGTHFYHHMEDLVALLQLLEAKQAKTYGQSSEEVCFIRHLQCHSLQGILDYFSSYLETASMGYFGHGALSSAVDSFLSRLPLVRSPDTETAPSVSQPANQNAASFAGPLSKTPTVEGLTEPPKPQGMWSSLTRSLSLDVGGGSQAFTESFTAGFLPRHRVVLSPAETLDRLKKAAVLAVDAVLFAVPISRHKLEVEKRLERIVDLEDSGAIEVVSVEHSFVRSLADFLTKAVVVGMERNLFQRKANVMWQAKDILRMQFCRLVTHLLSPGQDVSQRIYATALLANEPKCRELLKLTMHIRGTGHKIVHYLYDLLSQHTSDLGRPEREEADEILTILQQCGLQPIRLGTKVTPEIKAALKKERTQWELEHSRERVAWLKRKETMMQRALHKLDALARRVSGDAMEATQSVVNAQNEHRKKFMERVKQQMTLGMQTKKDWQQLIQQLTHERGVWHCAKSHPPSWQLDPTEGPCRVRRRLQRCHLNIAAKFLAPGYKGKLDAETHDPPLSFLFQEDTQGSDSTAIIYKLHTNEKIRHMCTCSSVTPSSETTGELLIGLTHIYFVASEAIMDANYTQTLLGNSDLLFMVLPLEDVKELHRRWYQLKDNALEIFLTSGKTFLLAFHSTKERDQLYEHLYSKDLPNLIHYENLAAIQRLWLEGRMSNFEYLTHLNKMAGRSFNDLMQYPVFPFVLATYNTDTLDLESSSSYRTLSKPISVQHKSKEQRFIDNYKALENEKKRLGDPDEAVQYKPDPFHYGSHYSNSGTVLHFLVRLPPFTGMLLSYQDQNFDLPDRTFHCMQTSWHLASFLSSTDVKELIPEFFFLPEFFCNNEGFNFGMRQTGERVWDVILPEWCQGQPRLFTLILRQALESDHITQHLPAWVDLVFGYKQSGKPAIEAINVFHPSTYFGIDVDGISDPVQRNAIKTMIKTYGQTPKQLFKLPHPGRQLATKSTVKPRAKRGTEKLSPLASVSGLRWGSYVGSPDCSAPALAWKQSHGSVVSSLVALPTGEVFGLGPCSCLLVMYSKEKGVTAVNTVNVLWAAILSWGHPDDIIRVRNKRDQPQVNFLHWRPDEQVTCCASVPDCRLLLFGSTSGVISVFNTKFNASKPSHLETSGHRQCLYGHSGMISSICVCKPYSVVVSASHDTTCIIWDLNRLTYIRSISEHEHAVRTVCVSETSGDIASVSHTDEGSCLTLHTINAQRVARQKCSELVLCLAFSHCMEGRAVNVLAGGLSDGNIRMWSSWDLLPIRDVNWEKCMRPVVSLTFTPDSQRLFAATTDGQVSVWETPPLSNTREIVFVPFL